MNYRDMLSDERAKYAKQWSSTNAEKFEGDGHYDWMASFIKGKMRVLEIGTGDGRGTLAMLARGHSVVSVDENPACLRIAEDRLSEAGIRYCIHYRGKVRILDNCYRIDYRYRKQEIPSSGEALLLEGDTVSDLKLLTWLTEVGPFDAVVCWLIGTHEARMCNTAVQEFGVAGYHEYRLLVQNRVYELADSILASGGLLHVVDRGQAALGDNGLRQEHINLHLDQARDTSLEFANHEERSYEEAEGSTGVPMVAKSGPIPDAMPRALKSVLFRKP